MTSMLQNDYTVEEELYRETVVEYIALNVVHECEIAEIYYEVRMYIPTSYTHCIYRELQHCISHTD